MIPKVIHYCWFGGNPLPKLAEKCIASWRKFLPDYSIKRWDESNFDISACDYVREAYRAKKWAFVSDYARFKILYEQGGLYFDTDVEIIKPLDPLLRQGNFMGLEREGGKHMGVNPGLGLSAAPGLELYKELLENYHRRHFINSDGTADLTTVVTYTTEILKKHGLTNSSGIQQVAGIYIYPTEYFCPLDTDTGTLCITKNTYTIHHFMASWCSASDKFIARVRWFCKPYGRLGKCLQFVVTFLPRVWLKMREVAPALLYKWKHRKSS